MARVQHAIDASVLRYVAILQFSLDNRNREVVPDQVVPVDPSPADHDVDIHVMMLLAGHIKTCPRVARQLSILVEREAVADLA
jgi:hypothetical protein